MKTRLKKYLFGIASVLFLMVQAACNSGSTVDTQVLMDENGAGSRVFSVVIDQNVFNDNFNGEAGDLYNLVATYCPGELTWAYGEDDGNWTYTFTLAFKSLEDYKTKVEALAEREVLIEAQVKNNTWGQEVVYREDFDSTELLGWLKLQLFQYGYVSEDHLDKVFGLGDTHILMAGQELSGKGQLDISESDFVTIDRVDFLTEYVSEGIVNRTVVFGIPNYNHKQTAIDKAEGYFKALEGMGMKVEYADTEMDYLVYRVSASNVSYSELGNLNKKIFEEAASTEVLSRSHELYTLQSAVTLRDSIDLRGMLQDGYTMRVRDFVKAKPGMKVGYVFADGSYTNVRPYEDQDGEYPSYMYLWDEYNNEKLSGIYLEEPMPLESIQVNVDNSYFTKKVTATNTIVFRTNPGEDRLAELAEYIRSKAPGYVAPAQEGEEAQPVDEEAAPENDEAVVEEKDPNLYEVSEAKPEVTVETVISEDGVASIVITIEGTAFDVTGGLRAILDDSSALVDYSKSGAFFMPTKTEAYEYKADYVRFVGDNASDLTITVNFETGLSAKTNDALVNDSKFMDVDGKPVFNYTQTYVRAMYAGTCLDIFGVLFWVFVVVALVMIFLALYKAGIFAKKAAPVAAQPQGVQYVQGTDGRYYYLGADGQYYPAPEQPQMQQPQMAQPQVAQPQPTQAAGFCPNCGAALEPGTMFCGNCGAKIE